jgi:hypothetical protein
MLDFDNLRDLYNQMNAKPPAERGQYLSGFVWIVVAYIVYYLVAGFVVWSLGKRLIQASFAAYKEARRERT